MATYPKHPFARRLSAVLGAVLVMAAAGGLLVACGGPRPTPAAKTPVATSTPGLQPIATEPSGQAGGGQVIVADYRLSVRLSEGQAAPQAVQTVPVATGVPLPADALAQLLARLPQLTPEPADQ